MALLFTSNSAHHPTVTLRGSLSMRKGQEMMFTEVDRDAASLWGLRRVVFESMIPTPGRLASFCTVGAGGMEHSGLA